MECNKFVPQCVTALRDDREKGATPDKIVIKRESASEFVGFIRQRECLERSVNQ